MRYYTERPGAMSRIRRYRYKCNHMLYSECTLLQDEEKGLVIVQKRFNARLKIFWYGPVESWLMDEISRQPGYTSYFDEHAEKPSDGIYPTVTVRQIMWALRMKPLRKDEWESQELQFL